MLDTNYYWEIYTEVIEKDFIVFLEDLIISPFTIITFTLLLMYNYLPISFNLILEGFFFVELVFMVFVLIFFTSVKLLIKNKLLSHNVVKENNIFFLKIYTTFFKNFHKSMDVFK